MYRPIPEPFLSPPDIPPRQQLNKHQLDLISSEEPPRTSLRSDSKAQILLHRRAKRVLFLRAVALLPQLQVSETVEEGRRGVERKIREDGFGRGADEGAGWEGEAVSEGVGSWELAGEGDWDLEIRVRKRYGQ